MRQVQNRLFGQPMGDLDINLTAVTYYGMYPTLFRRKSRLRKNYGFGPRTDDRMLLQSAILNKSLKKTLTQRTINAIWMLLLLQLASICSDSRPEVRDIHI